MSFTLEHSERILDIPIDTDTGNLSGSIYIGNIILSWNKDEIFFIADNYGTGSGGSLRIELPADVETLSSFKRCLAEWKEVLCRN